LGAVALPDEINKLRRKTAELEAENRRLKDALHQSEELFNKVFQASSNMMAIHTIKEGRFVDVNEAAASLGGFKREELIGHTMAEYNLLADPSFEKEVARRLKEDEKAYNLEQRMRTKNGELRTVLASMDPITINNEPCMLAVSVDITEQVEKSDALRRSEEKYRMLVENSLQGLAIIQDSRFVFCNKRFAAMWGYSLEELLSLSPEEIEAMAHPDDRALIQQRYRDQLAGMPVIPRFEFRGIKKDASPIWLEAHTSVLEYNERPAIQSVYMDITERRNAENALRESEERFRLIAETIDEIFWIYDTEKQYATYLSPAFDRIWGKSRERVVENPKPSFDAIHPDDREHVKSAYRDLENGRLMDCEYRIIRPDGSIRHIWNRGYPVPDNTGKIKRYVGVGQDITAFKNAEKALKDSKEYFNQIINRIGDPIFVKDSDHRLVLVNDAMCDFIGRPQEELIGWTVMPDDLPVPFWEQEEEVFKTGREYISEDTLPDAQGTSHTLLAKKSLLTDKDGNKQIVGVLRDITEYKRLEAQFLQSQKMEAIGALAGGVAHDFNNLLNVINGYTELILEDLDPENPLVKDLTRVRDAGQRAATLTSQLLAFGRKQIMQPEIFNLNQVIANMSAMLRRLIGEDIEMVSSVHSEPLMVNADLGKIQQVVMNLVVNARDAMPHGGNITIETAGVEFKEGYLKDHPVTRPGPYAMLAISDNGIGMDAATQERIFEPFFTTKEKGKGTGLGLSTVYGIVKQSDGFVWVYSEPGKGTTAKAYFPRVTRLASKTQSESKKDAELIGSETVLVAEDEEAVRALVSRVLRDRGYNVLEAADGMEALRISKNYTQEIHLVVTDVVMPGVGGRSLMSSLKKARPGIKSLFISGYTDNAIVHHGILDSEIAFLQKPFSIDGLIGKVQEALSA
jgi:two-component system cell cycle sensor histidine kinase/response regulator CckA